MVKVFIGNLDPGSDPLALRKLFERFGSVSECDVIKNYGFVHMDLEEEAEAAIAALHGYEFNGTKMNVELSHGKKSAGRGRGGFDRGRGARGGFRGRGDGGFRGRGGFDRGRGGRGRGRGEGDRMNGYGRGGGYADPYERPRYSPYERPTYGREGASEYTRPVTYPGLGPRSYDYPPYGREYSRASPYDYPSRPSAYGERGAGADPYARPSMYGRERPSPAEGRDPYGRPGPDYYQARSTGCQQHNSDSNAVLSHSFGAAIFST